MWRRSSSDTEEKVERKKRAVTGLVCGRDGVSPQVGDPASWRQRGIIEWTEGQAAQVWSGSGPGAEEGPAGNIGPGVFATAAAIPARIGRGADTAWSSGAGGRRHGATAGHESVDSGPVAAAISEAGETARDEHGEAGEHVEAVDQLNHVYSLLRLYVNFFQPVMKLVEKTRTGARVHKVYDTARTPYSRLLESADLSPEKRQELPDLYLNLDPTLLRPPLDQALDHLWTMADRPRAKEASVTASMRQASVVG